jgi:hypothetical protein
MGTSLTDLTTQKERESALASSKRLDDFNYPPDTDEYINEEPGIFEFTYLSEEEDKNYWENIATIACTIFSRLQKGESISTNEIRNRFEKLKKTGYEVPDYKKMRKKDLWKSLMIIRGKVYAKLEKDYPDIKKQINNINQNLKHTYY